MTYVVKFILFIWFPKLYILIVDPIYMSSRSQAVKLRDESSLIFISPQRK